MSTVTFHLFSLTYFLKKEKDEYMIDLGKHSRLVILQKLSCSEGPALSAGRATDTATLSCVTTCPMEPRPGLYPPAMLSCLQWCLALSQYPGVDAGWLGHLPSLCCLSPYSFHSSQILDLCHLEARSILDISLGFAQLLLFHSYVG